MQVLKGGNIGMRAGGKGLGGVLSFGKYNKLLLLRGKDSPPSFPPN